MKKILTDAILGILLTFALMLVPYEYCMDGPGRGVPFAVLRPSHGDGVVAIVMEPGSKYSNELNVAGLGGDVVVWAVVASLLRRGIAKLGPTGLG